MEGSGGEWSGVEWSGVEWSGVESSGGGGGGVERNGVVSSLGRRPRPRGACGRRAQRWTAGWRLLLLDSMDGVPHDLDGHGHIGEAQLAWLAAQLDESAAHAELDHRRGPLVTLNSASDFLP